MQNNHQNTPNNDKQNRHLWKTEGKETHNIWLLGEAKQYGLVGMDTGRNQD